MEVALFCIQSRFLAFSRREKGDRIAVDEGYMKTKYKKHKNGKLTGLSKNLRKNMTQEERRLWYCFLKKLPITINKQKVFGKYIADFYCAESMVVIEIDGSQHFDEKAECADKIRTEYFQSLGIKVFRYSNYDVNKNFDGVCEDIAEKLGIKL